MTVADDNACRRRIMIGCPPLLGVGVTVFNIAHKGVYDDISNDSNVLDVWVCTLSKIPHVIGQSALRRQSFNVIDRKSVV